MTNIGDVETYGVEIELTLIPVESLSLNLNLGYVDTEIASSNVLVENIFAGDFVSPKGLNLPNQPKFSFNFLATYTFPLTHSVEGGVQIDYSYRSVVDMGLVKSPEEEACLREDGYGQPNLGLSLTSAADGWRVSARLEKALDEEYRSVEEHIKFGELIQIHANFSDE